MTVCVAAYGGIGNPDTHSVLVTASDRMITIDDIEYEPDQTKAVQIASHTIALLSGDMQVHAAVCPACIESLRSTPSIPLRVGDIAKRYALEYALHRRYFAETDLLLPLGLTINDFLTRQRDFSPEFIAEMSNRLQGYGLNAQAIIAGVDTSGPHIYKVH
jgi:hypothetical protein